MGLCSTATSVTFQTRSAGTVIQVGNGNAWNSSPQAKYTLGHVEPTRTFVECIAAADDGNAIITTIGNSSCGANLLSSPLLITTNWNFTIPPNAMDIGVVVRVMDSGQTNSKCDTRTQLISI